MVKASMHITNFVGAGVTAEQAELYRISVKIKPAFTFKDGVAVNYDFAETQNILNGELTVPNMETEYLGEPLPWSIGVTVESRAGGQGSAYYPHLKTFPVGTVEGQVVEFVDMLDVDVVQLPEFGPTWAEQARLDAVAAEASRVAAETAASEAAGFAGTNNAQVAAMVTGAGAVKDALNSSYVTPAQQAAVIAAIPTGAGPAAVSTLGDSITAGGQTDPTEGTVTSYGWLTSDYLGAVVFNPSVPGERMGDIATRFGAPITFTVPGGVIPAAATPFAVTLGSPAVSNFIGSTSPAPQSSFAGTFLGVDVTVRFDGTSWTMARVAAASVSKPVPSTGGAFRTKTARPNRGSVLVAFGGRNGGNLEAETRAMLDMLTAPRRAVLMPPLFRTAIPANDAIMASLASEYGVTYYDMRTYLAQHGMDDEGVTHTAQDDLDIAAGTVPGSLFLDGIHPTAAGHRAIARRLVEVMIAAGYVSSGGVVTPPRVVALPVIPSYPDAERGLDLRTSGSAANHSSPSALQSAQTLDIRMSLSDLVSVASQGMVRRQSSDGVTRIWSLITLSSGVLRWAWNPAGTTASGIQVDSSAALGATATKVRVVFNAATRVTSFYWGTDTDLDGTWTQLGTTSASGAASALFASPQPLELLGPDSRIRRIKILDGAAALLIDQDFTVPAALDAGWNLSGGAVIRTS